MATQLRIYKMKPGGLGPWTALFERDIKPLRRSQGFEIEAWTAPASDCFVWKVTFPGSVEDLEAADLAYYTLPEHQPLHEEALNYLDSSESYFLEAIDG